MNESEEWFQRGLSHYSKENYEQAILSFEHSLDYDPYFLESLRYIGEIYYNQENHEKAIKIFKRAIKIDPEDSFIWYDLSLVYNKIEDYDNAIDACDMAIDYSADAELWNFLGQLYINKAIVEENPQEVQRLLVEAANCFEGILDEDPENIVYLIYMGLIYKNIGRYDKAIETYQKILDIDSNNYLTWFFLAQLYYDKEEYNNALNSCKNSLSIKPSYDLGLNLLADINKKIDNLHNERFKRIQESKRKVISAYKRQHDLSVAHSKELEHVTRREDYKTELEDFLDAIKNMCTEEKRNKARNLIDEFETKARDFLFSQLSTYYDEDWWESSVPRDIRNEVDKRFQKRKREEPRRGYKKIEFLNLYDYYSIIAKKQNWRDIFSHIFDEKKFIVQANFDRISSIRNDISHGRFYAEDLIKLKVFIGGLLKYFLE